MSKCLFMYIGKKANITSFSIIEYKRRYDLNKNYIFSI
jgi:hypothetical protein